MDVLKEFVNTYGTTILYSIVTALAGYLGVVIKRMYQRYVDDNTKKEVVKTCVKAVEQLYKDLHGEDKYNKVVESASEMLSEKGISITDIEIKMLVEASVGEFNKVFKNTEE